MVKHPEVDASKRAKELRAEGKSEKEITDTIMSENDKLRLLTEITRSDPKYLTSENGPEMAMAEMEKRLKASGTNTEDKSKIEELTQKIEELSADMAAMNADEGINSSIPRTRINKETLTKQEEQIVSIMKSDNAPQKNIDAAVKKFRTSKGINAGLKE